MEINKRELNIIGLYEQGKTYGQIANELGLAEVNDSRIFSKNCVKMG